MFVLYFTAHTCALASHIALEDAAAAYQLQRVDFATKQQASDEYVKINPKARVPAMVTPLGILTETPAMLAFIAQSFPAAELAPLNDPFAFAEMQAFNSYLCSSLHIAHAHRMRGHRWADEASSYADMQRKVPQTVAACYDVIEGHLFKGPWVMGDTYSVADAYLFTLAQWMEGDGVDPKRFPHVHAHRTRMAGLANVVKAVGQELAGV